MKFGAGTYTAEWFSVNSRTVENGVDITVQGDENTSFASPFSESEPVVLYVKRLRN
jgi:hypothetical protein